MVVTCWYFFSDEDALGEHVEIERNVTDRVRKCFSRCKFINGHPEI